ncbi:MAG: hypothetical protein J6A01_12505 [Proteobacteria bacterium]|nr:hypothetical protein [Pseudomonadota bacterium]
MKTTRRHIEILMGLAIGLLSGCSSTLYVTNYPSFFNSNSTYGSIAVADVKNNVQHERYTRQLNADVVNGLKDNGYYAVADYTHENLTDSELISHLRENEVADLAVFSTVTDYGENYDHHIETETKEEVYYAVDEDGYTLYDDNGDPIVDHVEQYEVEYTVFERTSYADMSVIVVDVNSGDAVYNSIREGSCYEEAYDPDNFSSTNHGRWCALDKAVASEVYQICPTFESVRVDDDNVLRIYRNNGKKGWEQSVKFDINDKMKLVFWFPNKAYYNTFTFDIVYGSEDTVLVSDSIYWEGNEKNFEYDMTSLVGAANGERKFKIRLWNGKRVAFDKKIKVK